MLIYKITNDINNKVYIGQTTNTLKERIRNYYNEVKWQSESRPIISAMSKYGIEHFHFEIIKDNISTKQELDNEERKFIQLYQSLISQNGYNVELGGNSNGKHSQETKQKISEAQLGNKNHMYGKKGELNVTSKKVIELTTGKIYGSASLAAEELNINFSHICAVARGDRGSHKGYVFRYLDENNNPIQNPNFAKIKFKKVINNILPEFMYLIHVNTVPSLEKERCNDYSIRK